MERSQVLLRLRPLRFQEQGKWLVQWRRLRVKSLVLVRLAVQSLHLQQKYLVKVRWVAQ